MADSQAPRDYESLKNLIIARSVDMPKRLSQIATYAVENPGDVALGTAATIAQSAGVQPSALVRFSQSLGYEGFSDLQEVFRSRLRDRVPSYGERLQQLRAHAKSNASSGVIFDGFSEAAEKSLTTLRERIDHQKLERAVAMLAKASTIYLVGLRRSFPVTSYMAYAMGKLAIRNTLVTGVGGLAPEELMLAGPADCVLAVSFAPYASETISLVQAATGKRVPVVAITDSPFSPLAKLAKVWIEIQEADFEGFRSMAATFALAMSITVAVAEKRGNPSKSV